MARTLVLVRHAKSDWSEPVSDRDRPLAKRGRKQAPAAGRWLAEHDIALDLALVSPARRAQQTWALVAEELGDAAPRVETVEDVYTFACEGLLDVIRALPEKVGGVAMVGHNPAMEEVVETLTGTWVAMPTAAIAVIELKSWKSAGPHAGSLVTAGRPADGRGFGWGG